MSFVATSLRLLVSSSTLSEVKKNFDQSISVKKMSERNKKYQTNNKNTSLPRNRFSYPILLSQVFLYDCNKELNKLLGAY